MSLFPVNIVVEGPSDEILLSGALEKLAGDLQVLPYDVKFFPAGNAASATYLFESLRAYSDSSVAIRLIVDGDSAGQTALAALLGRAKRDGVTWKANADYFQVPIDTENLCSDRVKRILARERPAQVRLIEDTNDKITSFAFLDTFKKALARRAVELSTTTDLVAFKKVLGRVLGSIPGPEKPAD